MLLLAPMLTVAQAAPPHAGTPSSATVYKCSSPGGAIYQDAPCAPGTELRNFATDPPALSIVPATPTSAVPAKNVPASAAHGDGGAIPTRERGATSNVRERRFIRVGMTQAEVVQRIGKPDVDARNQRGKGQRWSYLPRSGDPDTITTVTLVDGRVAEVERKIVR
jgi:hypothetical protein